MPPVIHSRRPRLLLRALALSLVAALASGCISIGGNRLGAIDGGRSEVRPRLQPPTGRIGSGVLPSNAKLDIDCDFEQIQGSTFGGYVEVDAEVRCPDEDIVRYLQIAGVFSGPPEEDPPEMRVTLRFEPTAVPGLDRCDGSGEPIPVALPIVQQFDPARVAFSTTEVGVSDALAKRPMRRDEPMRFVAMTASTAPLRWRRSTYLCMLSQKWGMWPARDIAVRI